MTVKTTPSAGVVGKFVDEKLLSSDEEVLSSPAKLVVVKLASASRTSVLVNTLVTPVVAEPADWAVDGGVVAT